MRRGDPLVDGKVEARNRLSKQRRVGFPTRFLEEKADRNVRSPLGGFFHDDADRRFFLSTLSEACECSPLFPHSLNFAVDVVVKVLRVIPKHCFSPPEI